MRVLVVADQLLLFRLKDLCQLSLSSSRKSHPHHRPLHYIHCVCAVTLRNVPELLEIADTYSASQLKSSCLQFISVNAAALLEARCVCGVCVWCVCVCTCLPHADCWMGWTTHYWTPSPLLIRAWSVVNDYKLLLIHSHTESMCDQESHQSAR